MTPPAPRVSLIASSYRSERFLPTWIDNLESLTIWPEAELVLVANDPSPAESRLLAELAERHSQVRLLTVDREPLYRSWNRAIASSCAPLLGIANLDDLRTPDGLEAQVAAMESRPDGLFSYGPYANSTEFPPPPRPAALVEPPEFDRETFTRGMHAGPFFIWRACEDPAIRFFDEQLEVGGDFDLAVRLALHGEGIRCERMLGWYYNAGTGLSTGDGTQPIELAAVVLRYGIYDALDFRHVPRASRYVIPMLLQPDGTWLPVEEVVPDYDAFLRERRERWFRPPRSGWRARSPFHRRG